MSYKFESIGPKGVIKKIVFYRKSSIGNEFNYNLSFGDWDELNGEINDVVISNNKDTVKVLSTIYQTVLQFVNHFPEAVILIIGSTNSRTRLYQMAIAQNIEELTKFFHIQGYNKRHWENLRTGINYSAFLVRANQNKL